MKKMIFAFILGIPVLANAVEPCKDCGVVSDVQVFEKKDSGLGTVVGAVAGVLLGNQLAEGDVMLNIASVVGGSMAGYYGEQSLHKREWRIAVRMRNGDLRNLTTKTEPVVRLGDAVRVAEDGVVRFEGLDVRQEGRRAPDEALRRGQHGASVPQPQAPVAHPANASAAAPGGSAPNGHQASESPTARTHQPEVVSQPQALPPHLAVPANPVVANKVAAENKSH